MNENALLEEILVSYEFQNNFFFTFVSESFSFHPPNAKIFHMVLLKSLFLVYFIAMFCHYEMYLNST